MEAHSVAIAAIWCSGLQAFHSIQSWREDVGVQMERKKQGQGKGVSARHSTPIQIPETQVKTISVVPASYRSLPICCDLGGHG